MQNLFIILNYLSILVMFISLVILIRQAPSQMQKYAVVVAFSLLTCCLGFLFNIEAQTVEEFILSQKLKYAFITFGMFYMLLFILEYCHYSINKIIQYIFMSLNIVVSTVVLTLDHHQLFYKSYWLVNENGLLSLEKDYGFFHTITIVLFALYMAAAVIITIVYSVNNIKTRSKYVWRLLFAVSLPCLSYIIPKVFDFENDLQPIAFSAFTVMVLFMIYKNNLYDVNNIAANYAISSSDEAIIVLNNKLSFKGCNDYARSMFAELKSIHLDEKITGISKVLDSFIEGKASDYRYNDQIYRVSINPVTTEDLENIGKVIRFKNVTIERNYADLLQDQNKNLASQVITLSNYSYKDELTNCNNRRYYEEVVKSIRDKKSVKDLVLWTLDINGLKETNDNIGHIAGDEIIKATANILDEVFGSFGQVFRTGGDEFYIIIQNNPNVDNKKLANSLDKITASWIGEYAKSLSVSYGYIIGNDNLNNTIDELMIKVDRSMYECKRKYYEVNGLDRRHN